MDSNLNVIRFENLRQSVGVVGSGETEVVLVQARSFVANNAHGTLCEVTGHQMVAELAAAAGKRTLARLAAQ
jgi:hypothetical protein